MLFKTKKNFFMYRRNVNKTLTKPLLQFTEFCSGVSAFNFELVNVPCETFNIITIRHLHALSNNKNTWLKCEICLKITI